jgi:hypothetical protein
MSTSVDALDTSDDASGANPVQPQVHIGWIRETIWCPSLRRLLNRLDVHMD